MLANPWIPTAARTVPKGRHLTVSSPGLPRVLASMTAALAVVFSTVGGGQVVEPVALAAPVPTVPTFAPASTQPTVVEFVSSTRPSLPESVAADLEAETVALADRPYPGRPESSPQSASVEMVTTTTTPDIESLDLAILALDLEESTPRGVVTEEAVVVQPIPDDPFECHERAAALPLRDDAGRWDRNLVAQMTHTMFECMASVGGMFERPPTSSGWDAARIWGFENLAEQVAAESVVVAYCESQAFAGLALTGNNPWGYGGLFQMGGSEMATYGFRGASKFDPVDNAYAAATYFMAMNRRGAGWGGWGPWAVVNTGYNDDVNNQVKVPVLPRFKSTDPDFAGRRGVELPAWAVDPWAYAVPGWGGCPFTGRAWPKAIPLEG